jgi:hypothetical protein
MVHQLFSAPRIDRGNDYLVTLWKLHMTVYRSMPGYPRIDRGNDYLMTLWKLHAV